MALNADLRAIALTDSPKRNRPLEEVGVETAFSPHALIGRRLAHKAAASITVPEGTRVGDDVEVQELLVRRGSPLHGVEIRDTRLFEHPRLTIVAGWFDGELRLPPEPTDRLTPNSVLVVVGPADAIADVRERLSGVRSTREHSDVVVGAGHGGRAAVDALPDDVSVTTVAIEDREDVDVVGDPETLVAAGIEEASALVVTIDDDATALLATALARSLADEIEVLVRVTAAEKVRIAFEAGADYALSVQRPTARLLASSTARTSSHPSAVSVSSGPTPTPSRGSRWPGSIGEPRAAGWRSASSATGRSWSTRRHESGRTTRSWWPAPTR
jgi:Trk K+ transport system NAD-binding subunit